MNTYDLDGNINNGNDARVNIKLPKPISNTYRIANIYNVSDDSNKLLIHFQDVLGRELINTDENMETFTININNAIDCDETIPLDYNNDIQTSVYHDNTISSNDLRRIAKTVYLKAQTSSCGELLKMFSIELSQNGDRDKDRDKIIMLTPKSCGLGTIRP